VRNEHDLLLLRQDKAETEFHAWRRNFADEVHSVALCQGSTLVVPKTSPKSVGFSPCSLFCLSIKSFAIIPELAHPIAGPYLNLCVLVLIAPHLPAGTPAVLGKDGDSAGNIARPHVVVFRLVALQRNHQRPAHGYASLWRSAHFVHRPVSAIERNERNHQRQNDSPHPSPDQTRPPRSAPLRRLKRILRDHSRIRSSVSWSLYLRVRITLFVIPAEMS
jgi:hypothetical protein